jgi:8-oxo-dGTP diphosphatase
MRKVTAAILVKDNKILIAKRPSNDKLANKWEFPGGKIEDGETPEECLVREIKEEFNIDIEVKTYFGNSIYNYDHGSIELLAYLAHTESIELTPTAHDEYIWVSISELTKYDFAPADIPFVTRLRSEFNEF